MFTLLQGSGAGIMNISFVFPSTTFCLKFYSWMPIGHQGRLHENPLQITVIFTVETLRNVQIQDFDKSICYD